MTAPAGAGLLEIRPPRPEDGAAVHALIRQCPPLEANSVYCNVLQCTHFADTCRGAYRHGRLVGFVSAYRRPDAARTLFVWQVAVAPNEQGQGLGRRLLQALLDAVPCDYLETTITPSNTASWGLFRSLARHNRAPFASEAWLLADCHFPGHAHEDEHLIRIGPIPSP